MNAPTAMRAAATKKSGKAAELSFSAANDRVPMDSSGTEASALDLLFDFDFVLLDFLLLDFATIDVMGAVGEDVLGTGLPLDFGALGTLVITTGLEVGGLGIFVLASATGFFGNVVVGAEVLGFIDFELPIWPTGAGDRTCSMELSICKLRRKAKTCA